MMLHGRGYKSAQNAGKVDFTLSTRDLGSVRENDIEQLSDIIQNICDCVIDPEKLEYVMDRIRQILRCENFALTIIDARNKTIVLPKALGIDSYRVRRKSEFTEGIIAL